MMNDFINYIFGTIVTVITILLIGFMVYCGFAVYDGITGRSCYATWADYSPEYDFYGGCVIEWEGQRLPVNKLNINDVNLEKK